MNSCKFCFLSREKPSFYINKYIFKTKRTFISIEFRVYRFQLISLPVFTIVILLHHFLILFKRLFEQPITSNESNKFVMIFNDWMFMYSPFLTAPLFVESIFLYSCFHKLNDSRCNGLGTTKECKQLEKMPQILHWLNSSLHRIALLFTILSKVLT